jgi:aryl-alcohol dehydrogenase-like predicted oxidoreductase
MEMREFGGTGIRASVVGLGCNKFGIYQNAAQAVPSFAKRSMSESISSTWPANMGAG